MSDFNGGARSAIDWPAIEAECRAGRKSVREIARAHGISHTIINRKVRQHGWLSAVPKAANDDAAGTAAPARRPTSFIDLLEIVERSKATARKRPRTLDWCPYRIAEHPKMATPPKHLTMAMDDGLCANNSWAQQSWMNGGMISTAASEGMLFLGYPFLSELSQRPEFRVISETIATEMTRKWIRFKGKGDGDKTDKINELTDALDDLKVRERFCDVALHDGQFGRSHIFLDPGNVSDAELKTPIGTGRDETTKGKIGKKWLNRLQVVEPVWVYPTTYNANNPLAADWYNPQVWYVMGREIHRSRIPTFIGRPVPDLLKPAYSFGGISLSQMVKPYVDIWLQTRESVAEIVRSFSVMVLKTDLATLLQSGGGAGDIMARVAAFNALRDNQGTFVVNKTTEDFTNVSAPLGTLDHLQAQAQEHIASIARIPLVKFTGIQPMGLNASSDGEIRVFHETINAYQPQLFGENLKFIIDVVQMSLWGEVDPDIVYEWVPLWSLSEKEESELREKDANTDTKYIDAGVLSPEDVRKKIANDPRSAYPGLDPEDVPDLKEEEESGLEPVGGRPQPVAEGGTEKPGAEDDAGFEEGKHPRAPDGKFGSGGGGSKLAALKNIHPAKLAEHATAAREFIKGKSAQEVIDRVLSHDKVHAVARKALVLGINMAVGQISQPGPVDQEIKDTVAFVVNNFSTVAGVSIEQGRDIMRNVVRALIEGRQAETKRVTGDADEPEQDPVIALLEALLEALEPPEA